jgi:aldose 1-epimerase
MDADVEEGTFHGVASITLRSRELMATFLPSVGMTGVSVLFRGREYLAVPGGVAALRAGRTAGLPLLAPWANRLASRRYRAAGVSVDLTGASLPVDPNGLPIHGLLIGAAGWRVDRSDVRHGSARLRSSIDVDSPAFPFPHRIELAVRLGAAALESGTTVIPTGRRRVPVAFGWHPYLRLPGVARPRWRLRMPPRRHLVLDSRGIPNGADEAEPAEATRLGRRTFDDLYRLGRDRRLAFVADGGTSVELRCGAGYPYAQVWVPAGRRYAALEPMTAPTNALNAGAAPYVAPGERYRASFTLTFG